MSPRRIKEASVAGESPDKSEQRKSSGTAGARDPRLTVLREPAASGSSGSEADETAEGVGGVTTDTATAVFRTPDPADGDEGGPDREDGAAGSTGAAGLPASLGAEEGAGDAEDEASGAEEAPGGRDGASGPVADSSGPVADSSGPVADDEALPERSARADGPDGDGAANADAGADAGADDAEGSGTPAAGKPEAPGDVRLRAAVAAWVAGDDEAPEGGDTASGEEKASADVPRVPASREEPKPSEIKESGEEAPSEEAPGEETSGEDASGRSARSGREEPASGASASVPVAARPGDDETSASGPTPDGDGPDAPEESGGPDDAPEAAEKPAKAAEKSAKAEERAVDQPTTVFKAVRPRQVDQPTTALKLPPRATGAEPGAEEGAEPPAKSSTGPEAGSRAEPPAESSGERTSQFVPLRSDDVRAAPAPRTPGASTGAAVGPTVTPDLTARPAGEPAGPYEAERTRQQPMPPRPPLDLLAELTNTPPPPETPVRTVVRRIKIWTPLLLLVVVIFAIAQSVRPLPEPVLQLTTKPTYTFEGDKPSLPWPDEGQGFMAATGLGTVDSFGEQEAVPIGSVAKAMTAYIVLKGHPLKKGQDGPAIEIDAKAEKEGKLDSVGESTLNTVKAGDTLTEREALSAIMIPSANNIARLLARWDAGSEEAFVKKMNDTAKELGMTNTTYTDPSGLNATTVSSAEDQVKLGQKLVEIPALMDITKLPSWTDPSGKYHRNYNTLVPYDGALGIKTGSTTKAGGNLLFAAHKMVGDTDQLIVGAILGQHKPSIIDTVNAVSKEAMTATQDLLESRTVVKKGQVVGSVDDGFGHTTDVVVAEDVKAVGWAGLTVKLELADDGGAISHTAPAGTRVGTMTIGEGASQVKVAVQLADALAEPSFGDKLTRVG
ncbi:D-alanyl-D-alanine carboxypeptidase [Streptomyces nitrosporeus]|uniref:D-alanyl-D-alanine carboxypeptidase n=1 Tax=Streptomyces nitrosporeus TaxID=28894 RepID=UPI0039A00B4D